LGSNNIDHAPLGSSTVPARREALGAGAMTEKKGHMNSWIGKGAN